MKTESVDVLVSGQTFEHAEFFWETMLEIARVLKPQGLCCIIAPATGREHRVPLDCWRFFTDGFRALARYARLEVLHSRTHWEESAEYEADSNQWHESILIARKPPQTLPMKLRRALDRIITPRLRPLPQKSEALVQVFYSTDGAFNEEKSIIAGVEPGSWEEVRIYLPNGATARALRIDFMGAFQFVEIVELRVGTPTREYFFARSNEQFDLLKIAGDAERLPHPTWLRLQITGPDPQLYLPPLELPNEPAERVQVCLRVRF